MIRKTTLTIQGKDAEITLTGKCGCVCVSISISDSGYGPNECLGKTVEMSLNEEGYAEIVEAIEEVGKATGWRGAIG